MNYLYLGRVVKPKKIIEVHFRPGEYRGTDPVICRLDETIEDTTNTVSTIHRMGKDLTQLIKKSEGTINKVGGTCCTMYLCLYVCMYEGNMIS